MTISSIRAHRGAIDDRSGETAADALDEEVVHLGDVEEGGASCAGVGAFSCDADGGEGEGVGGGEGEGEGEVFGVLVGSVCEEKRTS